MRKSLRNIARRIVVGFLLLAISGVTISIHHEHAIKELLTEHEHGHHEGLGVNTAPSTYHEIHVVTFRSADSFYGSGKGEFDISLVKLLSIPSDHIEVSLVRRSTSFTFFDVRDTAPPSMDKCVLFCRFLI